MFWLDCFFFFVCLVLFFESTFFSSLYTLDPSSLSDVGLVKIFFPQSICCWSVLLTVSFALQKLFSFIRSHLSIVSLKSLSHWFRKFSPVPMIQGYSPLSLILDWVDLLLCWDPWSTLSSVQGYKYGSICILLYKDSQ